MSVPRHTAYNAAGSLVPLAVMAVALPPYLAAIGEARYGVLAVLWTVLGYLGLFDLGLGRAVTNRVAALHRGTAAERGRVVWTALGLNVALGLVVGAALWALAEGAFDLVVGRVPGATDGLVAEARAALPWMAAAFPLLLASGVLQGALMGRQEFLAQNAVRVAEGAGVQLAPLAVAVAVGPALPGLVAAVLAVRTAGIAALLALCVWRMPLGRPRVVGAEVRPLFIYGGWVTVTSTVGPLLSALDRVLIGALAGARAVTHYTVPFGVVSQLTVIPGSLTAALFPRFSDGRPQAEQDALQARGMRAVAAAVTPLVVAGLFLVEPGLRVWLGDAFAERAAAVGLLLLPGVWANCLAYVPFSRLQGEGRPDLVAKAHAAELVPYLGVLWVALQSYGVAGAAAAWSLRTAADLAVLGALSRLPARAIPSVFAGAALVAGALAVAALRPGPVPAALLGTALGGAAAALAVRELGPLVRSARLGTEP